MLLRHASGYFAAMVVQAGTGLVLLAVLTRLLSVEEYGRYALALAVLQIVGGPLFHWCRALVTRFLVSTELSGERARLLTTVRLGVLGSGAVVAMGVVGVQASGVLEPGFKPVLWAILPAMVAQAVFQVRTEIHRASLRLARCTVMIAVQGVLGVALSLLLAVLLAKQGGGMQAAGAILGLGLSCVVCLVLDRSEPFEWAAPLAWGRVRPMLGYSVPLAVIMALEMVLQSGDRFIIAGLLSTEAVAAYAAPQTLAMRSIANLCVATAAASLPIVIATLERRGEGAARVALRQSGELMMAATIPCTVAFVALAGPITDVMIGPALRHEARMVLPLIAVATCLNGLSSHYVAHGFQLARRTSAEIWAIVPAALVGVALNFVLVPRMGVVGAGYALIAAQAVYLGASLVLVRRYFAVPVPVGPALLVLAASLLGAGLAVMMPMPGGIVGLVLGGAVIAACAGVAVLGSGMAGVRDGLWRRAVG